MKCPTHSKNILYVQWCFNISILVSSVLQIKTYYIFWCYFMCWAAFSSYVKIKKMLERKKPTNKNLQMYSCAYKFHTPMPRRRCSSPSLISYWTAQKHAVNQVNHLKKSILKLHQLLLHSPWNVWMQFTQKSIM